MRQVVSLELKKAFRTKGVLYCTDGWIVDQSVPYSVDLQKCVRSE